NIDKFPHVLYVARKLISRGNMLKPRVAKFTNLPIELEKTGLHEALLDLNKFVTRENFINDLPMLIISGSEFQNVDRSFPLETHFVIKEIPERSL
ncbi:MAG: hypothetical protein JRN15_13600, partial [Nitrososphaerota archaeon]|nr:hypothetical protein [Nitrososphaerota archaeon]